MGEKYWEKEQAFIELCDMVVRGNMFCLTGSGISKGLKNVDNKPLPEWQGLLERIYDSMKNMPEVTINDEDKKTINRLLDKKDEKLIKELEEILRSLPKTNTDKADQGTAAKTINEVLDKHLLSKIPTSSGEQLIAVASLLRNANPKIFDEELLKIVTPEGDQTTNVHRAIRDMNPCGIMTYNYDNGHEMAWVEKEKQKEKEAQKENNAQGEEEKAYTLIVPSMKEEIRGLIEKGFDSEKHLILKAHGSTDKENSLVLTSESYSDLFTKYSYYKTLVQDILLHHQMLIVGFGMQDPDFDRVIQDLFTTFGGPIQKHVVIMHENTQSKKDILYTQNYGFQYLYVKDFDDIPEILKDATKHVGNHVRQILDKTISPGENEDGIRKRSIAHNELRSLNNAAKEIAAKGLQMRIEEQLRLCSENSDEYVPFELEEYVYSYGILLDTDDSEKTRKKFLIDEIITKCKNPKAVCHALYRIKDYLEIDDLEQIKAWRKKFADSGYFSSQGKEEIHVRFENGAEYSRNVIYCGFLEALVRSKYYISDKMNV